MNWQPAETAPKDGTKILVLEIHDDEPVVTYWYEITHTRYEPVGDGLFKAVQVKSGDGWNSNRFNWWMPIPPAPLEQAK